MTAAALSRPRTLDDLRTRLDRFRSPECEQAFARFRARPSDVFIATYPKCGTTWAQQIVHGLRTGGDMDFEEISAVVPWVDSAHDVGIDPQGEQRAEPRAFKTHLDWHGVPKGGRYIYVVRDPADVLVSFYRFFEGWLFEAGSISLDAFGQDFFVGSGSGSGRYWEHVASWWPKLGAPDTLMLCYEDMRADLPGAVRLVARFLGLDDDPSRIDIAIRQAGFEFMQAHERQFDDHLVREARDSAMGLPPGGEATKVREGRSGVARGALSDELLEAMDAAWREDIGRPLGIADYPALRDRIRRSTRTR